MGQEFLREWMGLVKGFYMSGWDWSDFHQKQVGLVNIFKTLSKLLALPLNVMSGNTHMEKQS